MDFVIFRATESVIFMTTFGQCFIYTVRKSFLASSTDSP